MTASDPPIPHQSPGRHCSLSTLRTSLGRYSEAEPLLIEAYRLKQGKQGEYCIKAYG